MTGFCMSRRACAASQPAALLCRNLDWTLHGPELHCTLGAAAQHATDRVTPCRLCPSRQRLEQQAAGLISCEFVHLGAQHELHALLSAL